MNVRGVAQWDVLVVTRPSDATQGKRFGMEMNFLCRLYKEKISKPLPLMSRVAAPRRFV
jgi:hypothetical protein